MTDIHSPQPEELQKKLELLEKEREEYLNGWKRAKADLINYQKDEAKRLEEVVRFAHEGMIEELLHVLDSFDLGMTTLQGDDPAIKGMSMIRAQLTDILEKHGVKEISVHPGEPLNLTFHESVQEVESSREPGTVHEVIERGYTLHGRVVRAARVKVCKREKGVDNNTYARE